MEQINLSKDQINNHVATTEDFWKEFHKSLSYSFSSWHTYKDKTFEEWVNMCLNTHEMIDSLNYLFQYPVIKGEYLLTFIKGFVLTNFRLIIIDKSSKSTSIPLSKIKDYKIGYRKATIITENDNFIVRRKLVLKEEFLNGAIKRCEDFNLSKLHEMLIVNKLSALQNQSNIDIPSLEMYNLPVIEDKVIKEDDNKKEEKKEIEEKEEKIENQKTEIKPGCRWGCIIFIVIWIIIGLVGTSQDNKCALKGCNRKAQGWHYYYKSQGSAFGHNFIGCVKKYESGGYCSRAHCEQDH